MRRVSQRHHLEDANILSGVKLERLWPVIITAIQSSGPLESAGMPVTNAGRASPGQSKTSSVGHGLWQRTRRAVSGGMSVVCRSRARLAVWAMVAHSGAVGSGALEIGSPG